jgi:hypothetical protein
MCVFPGFRQRFHYEKIFVIPFPNPVFESFPEPRLFREGGREREVPRDVTLEDALFHNSDVVHTYTHTNAHKLTHTL